VCLLVFSYIENKKSSTGFPGSLTLISNRDEYYERATQSMHWWGESGYVLAGKDLQAGGAWLGVSKDGRFAVITNYKEPVSEEININSRGELVSNFILSKELLAKDYLEDINGEGYAGFNLILGDKNGIHYFSNRTDIHNKINSGIHVLGNLLLNSETKKSQKAKDGFKELINKNSSEETLLEFMENDSGDLSNLDMAGFKQREHEEIPYRFIKSEVYGTRCTTLLTINSKGLYRITEQTFSKRGKKTEKVFYEIKTMK